jgi:uncharacterized SAM-binding protein YcdF (DUF218 family)
LSAVSLYLLSIRPVANLLIHPLERIKKVNKKENFVVVLGGGINPFSTFKASNDAFKREVYGIMLAKKLKIPFVFTGGGLKYKEADFVKKDVKKFEKEFDFKIKAYYENKSLNTYQNAKYTAILFKKHRFKKNVYLVTSAYHMKRAVILFKKFGFKITPKPVAFRYKPINSVWNFFPNMTDLKTSYLAIHEYLGILSLKLRGF